MVIMYYFLVVLLLVTPSMAGPRIEALIPVKYTHGNSEIVWKENIPDYPEEAALGLLAKLERENKIKYFLSSEQLTRLNQLQIDEEKNINYTNLCASEPRIHFPKAVVYENVEYIVLNPTSRPLQGIQVEVCKTSAIEDSCNHVVSVESGYTTKCIQEYVQKTAYLISRDTKQLFTKTIPVASCCSCVIR